MAATTVVKTIGTTGTFSTPQLWEDGAPADLTTAERSACNTFSGTFVQGESLSFVGSGATGKFLDSDGSSYVTYGITAGNPAASDVITGATATCNLISGTADFVGVIWQGQCQNQEFSGATTILTVSGVGASSLAYMECTTVAGASFRDHANVQSNALSYNASNGCGFTQSHVSNNTVDITTAFTRFSKLQVQASAANGRACNTNNGSSAQLDYVILEGSYTGVSATHGIYGTNTTSVMRNSVIIQRGSAADHIIGINTSSPSFYNVTIVASDDLGTAPTGILVSNGGGTVTVQNCGLFAGDSTKALVIDYGTTTFNFTTCYSDISGTADVTQTTYGDAFQNVNDATRDFRLKAGSALIDTGTTDATNAATDIAGTTRPQGAAYDVGAWELVVIQPPARWFA